MNKKLIQAGEIFCALLMCFSLFLSGLPVMANTQITTDQIIEYEGGNPIAQIEVEQDESPSDLSLPDNKRALVQIDSQILASGDHEFVSEVFDEDSNRLPKGYKKTASQKSFEEVYVTTTTQGTGLSILLEGA